MCLCQGHKHFEQLSCLLCSSSIFKAFTIHMRRCLKVAPLLLQAHWTNEKFYAPVFCWFCIFGLKTSEIIAPNPTFRRKSRENFCFFFYWNVLSTTDKWTYSASQPCSSNKSNVPAQMGIHTVRFTILINQRLSQTPTKGREKLSKLKLQSHCVWQA